MMQRPASSGCPDPNEPMRHPVRRRNTALLAALASVATLLLLVAVGHPVPGTLLGLTEIFLFVVAFTVAAFTLPLVLVRQLQLRPWRRLLRGEAVLARWTVLPVEWRRTREVLREMEERPGFGANEVDLEQVPRREGMEVVVTPYAIRVGGDFHALTAIVVTRVRRGWMEIEAWRPDLQRRGPLFYRFPIARAAQQQAERLATVA